LNQLLDQVSRLEKWVANKAKKESSTPPLKDALALLRRVVDQDTEPDPPRGGRRIVEGVAPDRLISLGDPEMRHGRKSRTKRFDGYKRHIAVVDGLILATAVEPANVREHEPAARMIETVKRHGEIQILDIDRGYLSSSAVEKLHRSGVVVNSRAWKTNNHGLFTKQDFRINLRRRRVTCPGGASAPITPTGQAFFDAKACRRCSLKPQCTSSPRRSLSIHPMEDLLIQLRAKARTRSGRAQLRRRTVVEHRLARIGAIQGLRARYRGSRKNELDLNRAAALANLLEVARRRAA
jgi:IS5 family transposase